MSRTFHAQNRVERAIRRSVRKPINRTIRIRAFFAASEYREVQ
jgi:hypothetical protein